MQFTDEEIETLKEILSDWGCDCPSADYAKVHAVGVKLGVWEEEKPPTEEELKRREDFKNSPFGLIMIETFRRTNERFAKEFLDSQKSDFAFARGVQWGTKKITPGTVLKIKLPSDYEK